ncbi:MAG: FMN-binding protein [Pseudomonadota bacterium]
MTIRAYIIILVMLGAGTAVADDAYQSPEEFLHEVFDDATPVPGVIWLKGDLKDTASDILGHPYPGLRIRYWGEGGRTAWILEEIGKVKPITVGLVVTDDGLETIRVLAFRESRGWEVRYPFFTDQFTGVGLTENHELDQPIDGISGATLSVRALKKLARLALYLHSRIRLTDDTTP